VVREFVHEQVIGPGVAGGRGAELAEDAATAVVSLFTRISMNSYGAYWAMSRSARLSSAST
jgi:hypothetical protein